MKKLLIVIASLIIMTGCATSGGYKQPDESVAFATITNPAPTVISQFNWQKYFVQKIDGEEVDYSKEFWSSNGAYGAVRRISPGTHNFVIRCTFNNNGTGKYVGFIDIEAELEAGINYELVGSLSGKTMDAYFINSETGKKAKQSSIPINNVPSKS